MHSSESSGTRSFAKIGSGQAEGKLTEMGTAFFIPAGYYKAWWRDLPKGPAHFGVSLSPGAYGNLGVLFSHFPYESQRFTKTGSGQT